MEKVLKSPENCEIKVEQNVENHSDFIIFDVVDKQLQPDEIKTEPFYGNNIENDELHEEFYTIQELGIKTEESETMATKLLRAEQKCEMLEKQLNELRNQRICDICTKKIHNNGV